MARFFAALDDLVASSTVIIDRPRGTRHPRYPEMRYPFDYGYLAGTQAADGDGIELWIGSLPGKKVTGVITTLDLVKRDAEIKVLIACTAEEAQAILAMHNTGDQSAVLMLRRD
jgi:inorganic pyrophosphatase